MANVLFVSKPVAPPWNDSSKNLVRDVACSLERHRGVVLSDVATLSLGPRVQVENLYRGTTRRYSPALWSNALVFGRLLLGRAYDVWHFFFAPNARSAWAAGVAARRRGVPTLQTVCSAPKQDADWRKVLFADCTVVLSRHTEARLLEAGVPPERLQRVPPAVAPLEPPDTEVRDAARGRWGLDRLAPLLVYPGDLEFSRGAERMLEVLADLPRTLGAQLVMACRRKTRLAALEEKRLRDRARDLGVARAVHWIGETREIHALLGCADLVMLPAECLYAKMDLPLALIEAMYLARAVVVGSGTPAGELAEDGGARSVDLDRDVLAETARVLLEDGAQREALGRRAREQAAQRFAPARVAAAYEGLYDELVDA
jgi:glycosyltransferase involved in cell wall biosynthesis